MAVKERAPVAVTAGPADPTLVNAPISPAEAERMLAVYRYPRQRPLTEWHWKNLAREITKGTFDPGVVKLARCLETGETYLLDAQHRLQAVAHAGVTQRFTLATYTHATLREVEEHYDRIDQGKRRYLRELPSFQRLAEEQSLTRPQMERLTSAIRLIQARFVPYATRENPELISLAGRLADVPKWAPLARKYFRAIGWHPNDEDRKRHRRSSAPMALKLSPFLAVGLITLEQQPERAQVFWERVAAMLGFEALTGEHHMVQYMVNERYKTRPAEEVARYVGYYWTVAYQEQTRQFPRPPAISAPIVIGGTTWDGRR